MAMIHVLLENAIGRSRAPAIGNSRVTEVPQQTRDANVAASYSFTRSTHAAPSFLGLFTHLSTGYAFMFSGGKGPRS